MSGIHPIYKRALVAGWFSYQDRKATFGDVEAKNVVCQWLSRMGIPFDVAGHQATRVQGVDLDRLNPSDYDLFIFVCGPWTANNVLLAKFRHCYKVGVNLTVWKPDNHGFDALLPRDVLTESNPDIVISAADNDLPLAGIALVHPQPPYGERQRHEKVSFIVKEFLDMNRVAPIYIDTLLENNQTCTKTVSQFESVVRRADVVISSRLHGMVFALKSGVPVVAIDPVAGGAKVTAQARALNWGLILNGDTLTTHVLAESVESCLNGSMSDEVNSVRAIARCKIQKIEQEFGKILLRSAG